MRSKPSVRKSGAAVLVALASFALVAACSQSTASPGAAAPDLGLNTVPPSPDPRVGLTPGTTQPVPGDPDRLMIATPAAEASWNLRLVANVPSPGPFLGETNSDLAFLGNYVIQGNYNGVMVWDATVPSNPRLVRGYLCPASQSDVSVYGNLMFVSGEGQGGRLDCGTQGVEDPVSHDRLRGIRIFDISDIANAEYVANVQTCRGSHTHTVVTDPDDDDNVYIYVSGSSSVRSPEELPGCVDAFPEEDPNSARFRIEVIRVPLAAPRRAAIVSSPRIFEDLDAAPRHADPPEPGRGGGGGRGGRGGGGGGAPPPRSGPDQCHDITAYPAAGLAGGACRGYGLLLDISDPENPTRLYAAADSNFALWHSATFSNDATKMLFSDEWGGGSAPRCRATDSPEWGANAIFRVADGERLDFQSYFKIPAAQTDLENCVAHNGSLIPIPGREVMVQGWYQGGISVFDWTDPANPFEIAFFDRGPYDATRLESAGSWSVYWYNGYMYSSEISRGLDVFELMPSGHLTQNEIDAARTVRQTYFNAQEQQRFEWPASFPLARAFLDQLQRGNGLALARIGDIRTELARIEAMPAGQRSGALGQLASRVAQDQAGAADGEKVEMLVGALRGLAGTQD